MHEINEIFHRIRIALVSSYDHRVTSLLCACVLQEVKDKHSIRIIEKLCNQLHGDRCSKSAGNQDTTLQNLDDHNGGGTNTPLLPGSEVYWGLKSKNLFPW